MNFNQRNAWYMTHRGPDYTTGLNTVFVVDYDLAGLFQECVKEYIFCKYYLTRKQDTEDGNSSRNPLNYRFSFICYQ